MTEWRLIPSWPMYEASDAGDIRRRAEWNGGAPGQPLSLWRTSHGYLTATLWVGRCKSLWAHRLVCEAFHGQPPRNGMHVAHYNGIKTDNRPSNLRWVTRSENERDKERHDRSNRGARNGRAVLNDQAVREIRDAVESAPRSSGGKRIRKGELDRIARRYGVTKAAINNIIQGSHWRHVR
jgi:hypothetical protein